MSKRKSKKSKNTTLIVFLVITFIIAIALLLYFLLWKENYGEIRENMTSGGHGKGYGQPCTDADNYRCKDIFTCADKKQGKGTCKCKDPSDTHFSQLTDEEAKKFFKGKECIPEMDLGIYKDNSYYQQGCESISGVWDGSEQKCLPPGTPQKPENPEILSHTCYPLKGNYDKCKECCRTHVGADGADQVHWMSGGNYNPTFAKCVDDICLEN